MTSPPFMPLYPGEILATTLTWDGEERAVHLLLLMCSWASGALPGDPAKLAKVVGYEPRKFSALWPTVSRAWQQTPGGLVNARLEDLREHAQRLQSQRVDASRRAAEKRQRQLPLDTPTDAPGDGPSDGSDDAPTDAPDGLPTDPPFRAGHIREDQGRASDENSRPHPRPVSRDFHKQVIAAYHEALPNLSRVKTWTDKRISHLQARIRERVADGKPADTIEYWEEFFRTVASSDFLCGRTGKWRCDLPWLILPEPFAKVIEGRYENHARGVNGGADAR